MDKKTREIVEKIKRRVAVAKNVHTNPIEIGVSDMETMIAWMERVDGIPEPTCPMCGEEYSGTCGPCSVGMERG